MDESQGGTGIGSMTPSKQKAPFTPSPTDPVSSWLPQDWKLIREFGTIPYIGASDPQGNRWIIDRNTGSMSPDQMMHTMGNTGNVNMGGMPIGSPDWLDYIKRIGIGPAMGGGGGFQPARGDVSTGGVNVVGTTASGATLFMDPMGNYMVRQAGTAQMVPISNEEAMRLMQEGGGGGFYAGGQGSLNPFNTLLQTMFGGESPPLGGQFQQGSVTQPPGVDWWNMITSNATPIQSPTQQVPAPSAFIPPGWTALQHMPNGKVLVMDPQGNQWFWNSQSGQFAAPAALGPFQNNQADNFSSMWGLSNPLLLPLLITLMNRPTTMSDAPIPGLKPVKPVPGGAATIPGPLPTVIQPGAPGGPPGGGGGHGGAGGGGGGEGGDGRGGATDDYHVTVSGGGQRTGRSNPSHTQTYTKKSKPDLRGAFDSAGGRVDEVRNSRGDIVYSRSDN